MQDMMNTTDIAFPNIGLYLENVPSIFQIGGMEIYMYGIVIGIGVITGIMLAARAAKVTGMDSDDVWDFAIYAVIFSVLGARIYYIIFSWDSFKNDLTSIFKFRQGGLAIYGAVIAAFATLFIYSKLKKRSPFHLGDSCVVGLVWGQVIGRWGNFFNREVFGEYTDSLLAMRLPVDAIRDRTDITESIRAHMMEGTNYIQVHPTFLYESGLNLLLLILMYWYQKRKKFHGEICLLYLGGYGIIRFFVEGIRTDQLKFGNTNIAVSQMLGLVMFVGAVILELIIRICLKNKKINN